MDDETKFFAGSADYDACLGLLLAWARTINEEDGS